VLSGCLFSLAGLAGTALAQGSRPKVEIIEPGTVQLTGLYGIQFGGSLDLEQGSIDVDSAQAWTVQAGLRVQEDGFAYVSYTRQSTSASFDSSTGTPPSGRFDLDIGNLLVGGELDLPMRKHLVPFIALGIGATHFTPVDTGGRTDWFFSFMAGGGIKIPIVEHVGLRGQVRYLGTVINSDASWFCASSGGATCAVSLNDTTVFSQGDVTGGLYVSF
jgi:opacity protein-like surface antigen